MRYLIVILALAGVLVSGFALREHYRVGAAPCDINARWDCGVVNHSPFAEFPPPPFRQPENRGLPIASLGILGYAAIAIAAFFRRWWLVLVLVTGAVAFSVYLTYVEAYILETYCVWCVTSASIVALTEVATIAALARRKKT
jgi:uncharacterized membrane protein